MCVCVCVHNVFIRRVVGREEIYVHVKRPEVKLDIVVAIRGCQLYYISNELQLRIGRLTSDSNLMPGRYKVLTWILAWRS